jgi:hypothetical protein
MHERGVAAMGGAPPSPGKMRALRKNIARLLTVMHQEGIPPVQAGPKEPAERAGPPKRSKPRKRKTEEHQEEKK